MADMISGVYIISLWHYIAACSLSLRADFVGILASLRKPEPTFAPCHFHKSIDQLRQVFSCALRMIAQDSWRKVLMVLLVRLKACTKAKDLAAYLQQHCGRQRRFDLCEAVTICPALRLPLCLLCTNPCVQKLD